MTDQPLGGKVAFVAGGSSGINLGVAHGLGAAGAKLAILSRSAEKVTAAVAELTAAGYEAIGAPADVRDYTAVDAALAAAADRLGSLDIVISGAAGNFLAPAAALSANGFKTVVDIDLLGTFNVFRAAHARLVKPGASLIAISAPQGTLAMPMQIHACAAKAGVNMVVKCLALEWGPEGVRVNGIAPGPIAGTEGMKRLSPSPELEAAYKASIPLRDYGWPKDIADLAVFLCSDQARYITGTIIDCDGGAILAGPMGIGAGRSPGG